MAKRFKGIFKDSDPIDQPEGTYRDALNALLTKRKGSICSEEGNALQDSIPTGYTIIGDTFVYDGRHILFITDGTNSEIGIFDGDTYTTVVSEAALNFQVDSVLEAVSTINNQQEIIVYWTDNVNPPRFYNITQGEPISDINQIRIFSSLNSAPFIDLESVQSTGGSLVTGAYHFGIRLIAEDGASTGFMNFTPPVYINDETAVGTPDSYDGAAAGTSTNKSIQLQVSNLDTSFSQFQIAVIRKENDTIAEVKLLDERSFSGESMSFQYNGGEEGLDSSLKEVSINTASYATAKTIAEIDNVLYFGNLSRKPDVGYQKYANNVVVSAIEKEVDDGGSGIFTRDHYGNPIISFYDKSFKRGEVYALYMSFILENGSESRAYHIPGRVDEGTEKNTVSDPYLTDIDSNAFEYQLLSAQGSNNMAYWENEDETYPTALNDPDGNWEIWDVDSNGDPNDTGNTLQGTPVRHHHFPDILHSSFLPFEGTSVSNNVSTLGFEISNIKIPSDIIDKVRAVKFYYARRTNQNKRILDQGFLIPLSPMDLDGSPPLDKTFWMYDPLNNSGASIDRSAAILSSFYSERTNQDIGAATYVKLLFEADGDAEDYGDGDEDNRVYFDQMETLTSFLPSADAFHHIKNGTAKTYLEKNVLIHEATGQGFSFDIYNPEGEQGIAIEFENPIDFHVPNYSRNATDTTVGYIAELCSVRNNLYQPFDQQELVWTGVIDTDISKFDPRIGTGGTGTASGTITITNGSATIPAVAAEGSVDVGTTSGTGQFEVEVTVDGNSVQTTSNHTESTTPQDIAIDIRDAINGDATISPNWTASIDPGDDTIVLITSDNPGSADNGTVIDATSINESGDAEVSLTTSNASGGDDGNIDQLEVIIDSPVLGGAHSIFVTISEGDTKDNIATAINTALNNDGTFSGSYSSTVDTVPTDPVITITADAAGVDYNGSITIDLGNTGVTYTDSELVGGSGGETGEQFTVSDIYGGDIFIARHGTRRTGYPVVLGAVGAAIRHLIEYIVESEDNIKLRHEGVEDWEIYYPKSSKLDVLRIELDHDPDGIGSPNFIAYNPDYSSQAIIKPAIPGLKEKENISVFPTRVIRSAQGDNILGTDEGLRTFLENDFIDLTRTRGELTHLGVLNNILLPHMERSLIKTKGREELTTGDIRTFIGSGDIFSIRPDEISSTKEGFAGLQDQRCATTTPYGYFFVDRQARKVYLISQEGFEIVSDYGLHNFFQDELSSISLEDQLLVGYDNKWDRIFLTYRGNWTLSYYPQLKAWGSFHSYIPDYYLHDVNTYFTVTGDDIYEHNIESVPGTFYGSNENFEFEFIDNREPTNTKIITNINFISEVEDPSGNRFDNETFDQIRVNTKRHDSGDRNITVYQSLGDGSNARNIEGTWKVNKFRDLLVNGSIDINKPQKDQSRLVGKYAQVKLVYLHSSNKFIYLHDANAGMRKSFR